MVSFERKAGDEYGIECRLVECEQVCNQEKVVPREWINEEGTDVLQGFVDYAKPLIVGESEQVVKDGLPVYVYRKEKKV